MSDELLKSVEIDGEMFTIKKFPAMTGLQIGKMLIGKMSSIIPMIKDDHTNDEQIAAMLESLNSVTDKELNDLVCKCLKQCYKPLPAGLQAVMDASGNFGVDGVEYDMIKTIKLCVEAIKWGATDFFGERGSTLIAGLTQLIG